MCCLGLGDGLRITPASAGSTPLTGSSTVNTKDHPRVGGEHPIVWTGAATGTGSPPRRRGAHFATCGLSGALLFLC